MFKYVLLLLFTFNILFAGTFFKEVDKNSIITEKEQQNQFLSLMDTNFSSKFQLDLKYHLKDSCVLNMTIDTMGRWVNNYTTIIECSFREDILKGIRHNATKTYLLNNYKSNNEIVQIFKNKKGIFSIYVSRVNNEYILHTIKDFDMDINKTDFLKYLTIFFKENSEAFKDLNKDIENTENNIKSWLK